MIQAGVFLCPKCGKNRVNELEKWECKKENGEEKWIFFKVHLYQETGGSTEEEWNNEEKNWVCEACNFSSTTFKKFISKNI